MQTNPQSLYTSSFRVLDHHHGSSPCSGVRQSLLPTASSPSGARYPVCPAGTGAMGPDALGWYLGSVKISQWGLGLEWPFSKLVLNVRARGFWLEICASIKMQFSGVGMRPWIWKFHQIRGHRVRKLCLYNKIRLHNQNKNKTPFKKGIEKECWTERKETCSLEKLAEISSLVVNSRISNLTHMAGFQCNLQNHLSFYHLCTAGRLTPTVWRRPLHIPWCGLWWEYNTSNCCLLATRVVCSCSGL